MLILGLVTEIVDIGRFDRVPLDYILIGRRRVNEVPIPIESLTGLYYRNVEAILLTTKGLTPPLRRKRGSSRPHPPGAEPSVSRQRHAGRLWHTRLLVPDG